MQGLKGVLLCCGLLPALALAQTVGGDPQRERLVEQLRVGEALDRDDLVESAVARLEQMQPDSPEALAARARLAIRREQLREAGRLLNQLCLHDPASILCLQTRVLLKVALPEGRQRLQEARRSAEQSVPQALRGFESVLEGQLPSLELALEYWRLRSRLDDQREAAIANLRSLAASYPGHAGVRVLLADLLFSAERPEQALAVLGELAADPQASQAAAQREFQYRAEQPLGSASVAGWQAFIARYPDTSLAGEARDNLARDRRRLADPAWQAFLRGQSLLEAGRAAEAAEQLLRARRSLAEEPVVQGTLGLALMRLGRHAEAQQAFAEAQRLEQNTALISKWHDLQRAAHYWALVGRAEQAQEGGDALQARRLYGEARQLQPADPAAWVGLASLEVSAGRPVEAERLLLHARQLKSDDEQVLRGLLRLYRAQSEERARAFLTALPPASRQAFAAEWRDLEVAALLRRADAAAQRGDRPLEVQLLGEACRLNPDNPWLVYRLAGRLDELQRRGEADAAFAALLARQGGNPQARYAHALYLASGERDAAALDSLRAIPAADWSADMQALAVRLERRQLLARVETLRRAGQEPAAIVLLEGQAVLPAEDLLRLADWAQARGAHERALEYLQRIDAGAAEYPRARLAMAENALTLGRPAEARGWLEALPEFPAEQVDLRRREAAAWLALGERPEARRRIEALIAGGAGDALLLRDAARLYAADQPQQAIDLYAQALHAAGELPAAAVQPRDDRALSRASRPRDDDDWLARSLRAESDALFRQDNPTLRIQHDHAWRNDDVTPGLSDLRLNTTMLHYEAPLAGGRGFLRADQVNMDAGRFAADSGGGHREAFGTCALADDAGCPLDSQSASGTTLALGWRGEQLAFDLGHSPLGFEIDNWLGGVAWSDDFGRLGWTLTASRRPLSNSLLSYAGAVDPLTGIRWGGVTANGLSLGLSLDDGGDHGWWADLGQHWLRGEHVEDNRRTRLMAGYYRRLIERADERLRVGVNAMHWRYATDLGDYTLGQGGYYSPQRYSSLGVPVSYAWRNADWSLSMEGSLSWSWSRSEPSLRYPLGGVPAGAAFERSAGDSGTSLGYRLAGQAERRLSDHWALGAGFVWQHSEDYAPSAVQLQLRYLFDPWQGALPLGGELLEPYSEFK